MSQRPIASGVAPWLALGTMGLALVAALANRPGQAAPLRVAEDDWARAVELGADHLTPEELALRLLDDPNSVLVIDVRPAEEFARFHLPGSHNLDVPDLLGERGRALLAANPGKLVVLCSQGMTHPAQAWVALVARGERSVRVLEDGLDGFVQEVLTPPSLQGPAATRSVDFARARAAFLPARTAALAAQASAASAKPAPEIAAPARLAVDPARLSTPTVVSTAWVAARGDGIVLLDAREKPEDFAAGHLPGALHVPAKAWREERGGVPDELLEPAALAAAVGRLGIDADTEVVLYGDERLQDPALLALALISLGHDKLAILEGGFSTWKAEGRGLALEPRAPVSRTYVAAPSSLLRRASLEDVAAASTGGGATILDVRPADAFRGDVSTEARAGHIPGSLNRPYTQDVAKTSAGLYWKPVEDLRRDYLALGLAPERPVIVSCRTGHQAALTWFTLRVLLGHADVRWYDGSWKEWAARSELPVATGPAGSGGK